VSFENIEMSSVDLLLSAINDFSNVIISNPWYSAIVITILSGCLLRFYCRLTMGVYKDDQDMAGKTVLITGASDGIGKATAHDLARRNARVLLACRSMEKAKKVAEEIRSSTGNANIIVKHLELCSFESVRKCAQEVLDTEDKLHVLINNAGMSGVPRELTEDGCERTMQTNHLGHFLLTSLLLDLLKKSSPSRIINVSSFAHHFGKLDLDDLTNKKQLSTMQIYGNTKLANVLFTRELAERLDGTGVTVNALHPGCVKTEIFRNATGLHAIFTQLIFSIVAKNSEEGAFTTIRLAVDPSLDKTTGKYFSDCKEARVSKKAKDKALYHRFFELSEQIVGAEKKMNS